MTDVIKIDTKSNTSDLEKANDHLLDAADLACVLQVFLNSEDHEFVSGRGATVAKEINRLVEAAREKIVDT